MTRTLIHLLLLLFFPPLMLGVCGKTKAWLAGRQGPPILQPYLDVLKLLRKGAVLSRTTTWVFRAGPIVSLAAALAAGLLVPLGSASAPLSFAGDVLAFTYLFGLARFFTMVAALDTGSSFEGMGASREAAFAALAEPALLLALMIVCIPAGSLSFAEVFAAHPWTARGAVQPEIVIAVVVLFCVLLAENARVPVDDPATHLELTMIHEVMVLDHGGPDFAYICFGSALKLFVLAALVVRVVVPMFPLSEDLSGILVLGAGELVVAVLIGIVESSMARLRLVRVPQLLVGASVAAAIGLVALFFRGQP